MEPRFSEFSELCKLIDPQYVGTKKIDCIKIIRQITGEGLKETKDFFEQVWQPTILKDISTKHPPVIGSTGTPHKIPSYEEDMAEKLPAPMFLVGHTYKQLDKSVVLILGTANTNTSYETVYSVDKNGNVVHCYNRKDFGRVTGSDPQNPDPRNLEKIT